MIQVDTSAEKFGDAVTIAHLAANSFRDWDSNVRHIYSADAILTRDWKFELERVDLEYATGVSAHFKDGSALHVAAAGDCCRPGDANYGDCHWCGGRY